MKTTKVHAWHRAIQINRMVTSASKLLIALRRNWSASVLAANVVKYSSKRRKPISIGSTGKWPTSIDQYNALPVRQRHQKMKENPENLNETIIPREKKYASFQCWDECQIHVGISLWMPISNYDKTRPWQLGISAFNSVIVIRISMISFTPWQ